MGKLDVVFYHLVGEDDSLIGATDPGGLGFDLDRRHAEFFEDFLLETGGYVGAGDVGETKEKAGSNLGGERENNFGEDGAESILIWERFEFCFLLAIFVLIIAEILNFLLNEPKEACELVFKFTLREHGQQVL